MDQTRLTITLTLILLISPKLVESINLAGPRHILNAHNAARADLGLPSMKWDSKVTRYARHYANTRKAGCGLVHSGGSSYGENIAMSTGDLSGVDAVNLWLGEKPHYDVSSNTCVQGECLHYTQIIWANSTRLGCAKVRCHNGRTFITCNYDLSGNFISLRPFELKANDTLAPVQK